MGTANMTDDQRALLDEMARQPRGAISIERARHICREPQALVRCGAITVDIPCLYFMLAPSGRAALAADPRRVSPL